MNSKVTLHRLCGIKKENKLKLETGDLALVHSHISEEKELVRMIKRPGSRVDLCVIGQVLTYTLEEVSELYVGEKYATVGGRELEIIGVCDITISIEKIKTTIE
ncbi:MAG: hypothetical protein RR406_00050 [Bacilli bacterium]